MAKTTVKDMAEILERIQTQLAALSERVEKLEAAGPAVSEVEQAKPVQAEPQPAPQLEPPAAAPKPEITEEEMIAVSAALAAYLGVRVRIKQIRLLSSHAWAQQGRVSIQASHILHN
jgi:methylmalonyl-CoA carboxyltransferase 12S subunit